MEDGITVCLLAYREEENLKVIIPQIKDVCDKIGEQYEILVVDTAEPLDNTPDVCKSFGSRYVNQEQEGYGGAFRTGIKYATFDKILYLDSDLSHDPKNIADIYNMFSEGSYDIVIGSRYVDGGVSNDSNVSFAMSKILNFAFRIILGLKARDISTSYRMYRTEDLRKAELSKKNYDVLQEVFLRIGILKDRPLSTGETPIVFNKRLYGESKRQLLKFICNYASNLVEFTFIKYPLLKNLLLYFVIGVIGLGVDFGVFTLATSILSAEIANVVGAFCGFLVTFSGNTFLNFKKTDKLLARFISYASICLIGTGISTLAIHLLKTTYGNYHAKLIAMGSAFIVQFILNKFITYGKVKDLSPFTVDLENSRANDRSDIEPRRA